MQGAGHLGLNTHHTGSNESVVIFYKIRAPMLCFMQVVGALVASSRGRVGKGHGIALEVT